jgi:hypothetical protein
MPLNDAFVIVECTWRRMRWGDVLEWPLGNDLDVDRRGRFEGVYLHCRLEPEESYGGF